MGKLHRTAQGREIDMEQLKLKNEFVPAIGNMRVNARGDELGPGGRIVRTREEIMSEYHMNKVDPNQKPVADGPVPTRSPKAPTQPIPTSSKSVRDKLGDDFVPASVSADIIEEPAKGGLARAVEKAQKKEKGKKL